MNYKLFKQWLPTAIAVTLLSLMIYAGGQNILRSGANDPQIQLAEDTAAELSMGNNQPDSLPKQNIDISTSLAPFVAIYDSDGQPKSSTGTLNGQQPTIPQGVFESAKTKKDNRVTWEPRPGIRIAIVVKSYSTGSEQGFVIAGRSLREVEKRVDNLFWIVTAGWLVTMAGTLASVSLADYKFIEKIVKSQK